MADAGTNGLIATALFGPKTQAQLMANAQQQELAKALLAQGQTPLDTNNRQIGGVGYAISPFEGLAKGAQTIAGTVGQYMANQNMQDIYSQMGQGGAGGGGLGGIVQSLTARGLDPTSAMIIASNPEALARAQIAFNGPTEQQKNFGGAGVMPQWINNQVNPGAVTYQNELAKSAAANAPAGTMPQGVGGMAPPMQGLPPPLGGGNLPDQLQGIGQVPPVDASQLNAPNAGIRLSGPAPQSIGQPLPQQSQQGISSPAEQPPSPQGMTNAQYQAALDAWKAKQSAIGEGQGKSAAEAEKAQAVIDSRYDNSQAILAEMRRLAPQTSGGPSAHVMEPLHRIFNDKTSGANKSFENLAANQLTTALAPIVQGTGGRIDIPLLKAINEAESVELTDSSKGKIAAIDNLTQMLDKQRQNARNLTGNLTGQPTNAPAMPFRANFSEGQTATGPGGHRIVFRNGQWAEQ